MEVAEEEAEEEEEEAVVDEEVDEVELAQLLTRR